MLKIKKILYTVLLLITILFASPAVTSITIKAAPIEFVILSAYKETLDIGDEFYLIALTSNGKMPTFKSSSSSIASVNTYGKITAKKSGTATITAKIKNGEATCKVTVRKTEIALSKTSISIEHGETFALTASTSNRSQITWKSNKKSVAAVDDHGKITGVKPGEAVITASADGTSKTCRVTVKAPSVKLSTAKLKLNRGQTAKLSAVVSSKISPSWRTNKSSVATVREDGTVTAIKHGTAIITATVDGISRTCEVTVEPPKITLSKETLNLKAGTASKLSADVSSGNPVVWSTSNERIATVSADGTVTAWQKGKAYIYASEDGTKVRCVVTVTETTDKK